MRGEEHQSASGPARETGLTCDCSNDRSHRSTHAPRPVFALAAVPGACSRNVQSHGAPWTPNASSPPSIHGQIVPRAKPCQVHTFVPSLQIQKYTNRISIPVQEGFNASTMQRSVIIERVLIHTYNAKGSPSRAFHAQWKPQPICPSISPFHACLLPCDRKRVNRVLGCPMVHSTTSFILASDHRRVGVSSAPCRWSDSKVEKYTT